MLTHTHVITMAATHDTNLVDALVPPGGEVWYGGANLPLNFATNSRERVQKLVKRAEHVGETEHYRGDIVLRGPGIPPGKFVLASNWAFIVIPPQLMAMLSNKFLSPFLDKVVIDFQGAPDGRDDDAIDEVAGLLFEEMNGFKPLWLSNDGEMVVYEKRHDHIVGRKFTWKDTRLFTAALALNLFGAVSLAVVVLMSVIYVVVPWLQFHARTRLLDDAMTHRIANAPRTGSTRVFACLVSHPSHGVVLRSRTKFLRFFQNVR